MTLLKHLLGGLAKLIGTKATIAVSVVAVTVTTGAVGFAGYKVVGAIQERQQNSAFVQAQVEDEDSSIKDSGVTASKGTVTSDEQVQPIQSSANQQAEESTTGTTNSDSDNGEDEQANDNDQKDTASEKRAERLANVKGKKATATGQLSATQLTQQEILHLLAANSLNDIQASTHIQDPNASTSSSTNSSNHDNGTQNNTNSPTQNGAIQNPEPVPNGPNFINHSAQAVTPAVLYGTLSGVTSGSATVEIQPESKKKYTVMIYLCGTDLETNGHDGTNDILNMLASSYDMSQVNVLLCAGGTTKWHNTYMSGAGEDGCDNDQVRCNIYQLNPGAWPEDDVQKDTTFEWDDQNNRWENETAVNKVINANTLKLLGSYDAVNMGDGKLFAGFVDLCTENFPADNYGAILWNHGGGINGGICSSESTESVIGDSIETSELESALACTKLYSEQKQKLAFVGFDACLMGSTELAYNLSPYCDYMVGSSEISAGGWNYKSILNDISGKAVAVEGTNESIDNESIAKNMVELYYANHPGSADAIASIACYDTTKIQDAAEVINEASDAILQLYNNPDFQTDCYQMIKQARIHSFTTGGSGTTTIRVYNSDYVDIGNFFKQLSGYFGKYNEEYQKLENKNSEVADQLSQICSSIDSVLNQKYILNAGVQYDGNKVMYQDVANQNAAITGSYGTYKADGANNLWASSLFMPFFTLDNEDAVTKVANYKKYTDMSIMSEYAALIEKYAQSAKADEDRIKRLAAEIVYSDKFKDLSEQEGDQVITMQEIAKADKKTAKVVHMEFKEETTEDHPFTDFMDTIDKTTVYVSRYQKIEGTDGIDMVLGSQDVSYSNISNQKESIDIVTDVLSNLYGYQVYGTQDEKWVYDWAHLSELEKDEDSKRTYIGNLVNQLKTSNATDDETKKVDYDAVKWLSFGGKFGKADDDATTYKDACLYFYNTIKDGVESYAFAGATYSGETGEVTATKETLMGIGQDYSVLQFYHYMIFGGEETKIEDIAETSFVAPTLKMEDVSIYKTALAYVDSQYNDYTVGFTSVSGVDEAGKETDPKQYILDSGQCKEDASEYQKNDKQVGNEIPSSSENGLTTISGQNTNSQPPVKGMEVEATTASGETLTTIMTPEVSPMPEVTAVPDTATVPEVTITPESTTTPEPTVTATPTVVAAPTNTAVSEITTTESTTTETTAPETTTTEDSSTEENSTPEPAPIEAIPTTETTVIEMAPPMEPAA